MRGAADGAVPRFVVGRSDSGADREPQRVVPAPAGPRPQPVFGFLYHLVGTRRDGRDRRRPLRVHRVPERRPDATAAAHRRPRGADVRRSVEQRAAARARGHARSREPRHHRARHAHLDVRADDRRRSRRRSAATRSPAPRRSTTTRSASTARPPTNAGTGHYTFETKGNHTVAVERGLDAAPPRSPGPDLPAALPAVDLGTADDHLDAHVPRQRDPLGPPALTHADAAIGPRTVRCRPCRWATRGSSTST